MWLSRLQTAAGCTSVEAGRTFCGETPRTGCRLGQATTRMNIRWSAFAAVGLALAGGLVSQCIRVIAMSRFGYLRTPTLSVSEYIASHARCSHRVVAAWRFWAEPCGTGLGDLRQRHGRPAPLVETLPAVALAGPGGCHPRRAWWYFAAITGGWPCLDGSGKHLAHLAGRRPAR